MAMMLAVDVGAWGVGPAAADSSVATLRYTCSLPPFPDQTLTAQLGWAAPDSVAAGRTTPVLPINATATVSATATGAARLIGAATVEGSVDATGVVSAPDGDLSVTARLTVPRTGVPASGPMTVRASGTTPTVTFHRPGHATVRAGRELTVHLTPRNASGGLTVAGQLEVSCTLDPGQNNVLSLFEVTAVRPAPVPTRNRVVQPTTPAVRPTGTPTHRAAVPARSGSVSSPAKSAAQRPAPPGTAPVTATADPIATATRTGPAAQTPVAVRTTGPAVDWWRVVGGILVVLAGATGCAWWLAHRRWRHGRGSP